MRIINKYPITFFIIAICIIIVATSSFAEEKVQYRLTIIRVGPEGNVSPGFGTFFYEAGSTAFISALPSPNYAFDRWEGAITGTDWFAQVLMNSHKTVYAVFVPADWRLTLEHSGNATGNTYPPPGVYAAKSGQVINISCGTSPGVYFGGWEGDVEYWQKASEFIQIPMDRDKYISAVFVDTGYELNIYVEGEGGVTPGPWSNPHRYAEGLVVTVRAYQTNPLWRFNYWTGDIGETNEPLYYILYLVMDQNRTITAHFMQKPFYTLTIEVVGEGTTNPPPGTYQYLEWTFVRGEAIETTPGWVFDHWEGDFGDMSPTYPRFAVSMDQNRHIIAVFRQILPEGEETQFVEVPNVIGYARAEAESILNSAGLTVGTITELCSDEVMQGYVINQDPSGGVTVELGNSVHLWVSAGPCFEGVLEGEGEVPEGEEGIIEGEEEGVEEGEETCIWAEACPNFSYQLIKMSYYVVENVNSMDVNQSQIPDVWEAELIKSLLCTPQGYFNDQFVCKFIENYQILSTEPMFHISYYLYRHLLAGLLTIGWNYEELRRLFLLTKHYSPLEYPVGVYPLFPDSDADQDGLTNYEEYVWTVRWGGNVRDYVKLVLTPNEVSRFHSADVNRNRRLELSELLRIIQFFNMSGFHCESGTEDGYAPGYSEEYDFSCPYHDSDYLPPNWHINLEEILRAIQIFNSRSYFYCPLMSEDNFCIEYTDL